MCVCIQMKVQQASLTGPLPLPLSFFMVMMMTSAIHYITGRNRRGKEKEGRNDDGDDYYDGEEDAAELWGRKRRKDPCHCCSLSVAIGDGTCGGCGEGPMKIRDVST